MTLIDRIDKMLWKQGFGPGPVRLTARTLLLLAPPLFLAGLVLLPWLAWPFWLGLGAVLSAWNFYSMALFVQRGFPGAVVSQSAKRGLMAKQILRSNFRLFITGILVYIALVYFRANPFALVAGLSLAVLTIPLLPLLSRA